MKAPHTSRFSPRVLGRIEDAGASAYAWHDQELTTYLDPSRVWSRLSWVLGLLGLWGYLSLSVILAWSAHWWLGAAAAAVVLLLGLLRRGFTAVPVAALVLVGLVAAGAGGPWLALTAASMFAAMLGTVTGRWRSPAAAAVMAAVLVVVSGDFSLPVGLPLLLLTGVAAVAVAWFGGGGVSLPFGRIDQAALTGVVPPPPSRVPWLVRLVKRGGLRDVPPEIEKKKAGAYGERRTALLLLGLKPRQGTRIFHDVLIPGAETANADHVVLARSGLYVIDTKQFGTRHDPGRVVLDTARGDIVHNTVNKTMPLAKSIQTVTWATRAISATTGVQATPMLAVHNAAVAPGLRAMMSDGLLLDVVSTNDLISRIEQAPAVFTVKDLARLGRHLAALEAATGDGPARGVAPLGLAPGASHLRGSWAPSPETPAAASQVATEPPPAAQREAPDQPLSPTGPTPVVADGTDSTRARRTAHDIQTPVLERWASMRDSEPAAPDEVPQELRGLAAGTPIYVITFAEGDVQSQKAIAMSGVCRGTKDVTYVWVCALTDWAIHKASGQPVHVTTVHSQQVMVRDSEAGDR